MSIFTDQFPRYMSIEIVFFCFLCICLSKRAAFCKIAFPMYMSIKMTTFVKLCSRDICQSILPTYIKPLPPVAGFWCYPLLKFVLPKYLSMGFFVAFAFLSYFLRVFGLHLLSGCLVFDIWFFDIFYFVIWYLIFDLIGF